MGRKMNTFFRSLTASLLALTFTPLGVEINGNRNWLSFGGPFLLQPSEAAKLALALWGIRRAGSTAG